MCDVGTLCPAGASEKADAPTRQTKEISMAFYNRHQQSDTMCCPSRVDQLGLLRWLLYVAAFIFYLFTRGTTVNVAGNKALFFYQLAVLVAECLHFISGALIGLWQVRSKSIVLANSPPRFHCCMHAMQRPYAGHQMSCMIVRRTNIARLYVSVFLTVVSIVERNHNFACKSAGACYSYSSWHSTSHRRSGQHGS